MAVDIDDDEINPDQFLTVVVSGGLYALPITQVREILEYGHVAPVPMMPQFMAGVFNLRGSVVPVIVLSTRFGMQVSPTTKKTCIVIAEIKEADSIQTLGIVVDSVAEVVEIKPESIEPPPSFGNSIRQEFISGVCSREKQVIIVLNAEKVLAVDEMSAMAQEWDKKLRAEDRVVGSA